MNKLQSAIHFLYPPQCLMCGGETELDFALCGSCWRDTPFVSGLVCDACGLPLPGEGQLHKTHCDSCLVAPKPWSQGRAALLYGENARRMVLALKHGDRLELAQTLADWMIAAAKPLLVDDSVMVPVPLHWQRLVLRRYNQASVLAKHIASTTGNVFAPDVISRKRPTKPQDAMTRVERFQNVEGVFAVAPRKGRQITGKNVLLVDDVMTSGATFSACTEACYLAGAEDVKVLVLARVGRDT